MFFQVAFEFLPVPLLITNLAALDTHREQAAQGLDPQGGTFQPEDRPFLFSLGLSPIFDLLFQGFVGHGQFLRAFPDLIFQADAVRFEAGIHYFKFAVARFQGTDEELIALYHQAQEDLQRHAAGEIDLVADAPEPEIEDEE